MKGRRTAVADDGMHCPGRLRKIPLERVNERAGGQKVALQCRNDRGDVIVIDRLPAVRQVSRGRDHTVTHLSSATSAVPSIHSLLSLELYRNVSVTGRGW